MLQGCDDYPMGDTDLYEWGFLLTPVLNVPSACGVMIVSKNGMEPSALDSSIVKWTEGSTELVCLKNPYLCD